MHQSESRAGDKPVSASTSTPLTTPLSSQRDYLTNKSPPRGPWGPIGVQSVNSALVAGQQRQNHSIGDGERRPNPPPSTSALVSVQKSPTLTRSVPAIAPDGANYSQVSAVANASVAGEHASAKNAPSPLAQGLLGSGETQQNGSSAGNVRPQPLESTVPDQVASVATKLATGAKGPNGTPGSSGSHSEALSTSAVFTAVNKPVHKMKRTGQNFPLSSSSASHSHQRNGSNGSKGSKSPIRRPVSVSAGSLRKVSEPVPSKVTVAPSTIRETPIPVPKIPITKEASKPPGAGPSAKLSALSRIELLKTAGPATKASTALADSGSDDIIYETAGQTAERDGVGMVMDDAIEGVSSSEESDSASDEDEDDEEDGDDETIEIDEDGAVALGQLFQAPDHENKNDDGNSSEDDSEDDDAISVSSSGDSTILNEPAVALPSAKIQHQEAHPSRILDLAEPGRPYTEFHNEQGKIYKASPALFPAGYTISTAVKGFPWICALRSCRLLYKSPAGLSNHTRFTHKKAMLNDNMDGTLSLVGSYSKKNAAGHVPPVVVSKRPVDPTEPPMREPSLPKSLLAGKVRPLAGKLKTSSAHEVEDAVIGDSDLEIFESRKHSPRPKTADRERSEEMWDYIFPFLTVHKTVPTVNWARHIIHLPRVRKIKWNEERNKEHPYKDSHGRDVTALIVQLTGVESPNPCNSCARGRGPFIGCILVSPEASDEVKAAVLSCANCYYHCGQSACSFCKEAIARRQRYGRSRGLPSTYNMKLLSDVARGRSAKAEAKDPQALPRQAVEASARRSLRLFQPSEFSAIENASTERTYKMIKAGKDGSDVSMCGALIPEKYDLDHTIAGYPWICPLRSCRKVFQKIISLGSHFIKAHPASLLNDNLDGTLSQVGYYNTPRPGVNGMPAFIISRNPLDPKEPPKEEPSRPGYAGQVPQPAKHRAIKEKLQGLKARPNLNEPRKSVSGDANELWDYMLPFLPATMTSVPSRIMSLLNLPRQRNIQWRSRHKGRLENDPGKIIGLIVYLTGEGRDNGTKECTHCVKGHGPFPHCIALKREGPWGSRPIVKACANCMYMHKASECSIKGWKSTTAASEPPADHEAAAGSVGSKRPRMTDSENDEPLAIRRRSDRLGLDEGMTNTAPRENPIASLRQLPPLMGTASGAGALNTESTVSTALIQAGQFQADDLLEMEDWEIAPGRIRATGAGGPNSFAFSKSYLETNQAMQVSRDVTFEVKTIKAGNNLELEADRVKTRYCTLSSGKLHVTIVGQEPFIIGQHGMFKIAPGLTARIQNRLYIDCVIHLSTYAEG